MSVCFLALLAGAVLPLLVPVVQFALGLVVVSLAGAALAWLLGTPAGTTIAWTAGLFACAQVGYGLGVGAIVVLASRRKAALRPDSFHELGSRQDPILK